MKVEIKSKYLVFPANGQALSKKLCLRAGEDCVYALNIRLDNINPDFQAYVDVSRFLGMELELSVEPEMEIRFRQSECMDIPDVYQEALRPQVHFSPKNGWNNDPNGLVYLNGEYHMFFQYNPCGAYWENMHWGHAVSRDLIHWEERDIALYPDDLGAMFSGSAIVDEQNLLGLQSGDVPTVVLYYTAASDASCQCMAYSTDGLKTIQKYDGNPVIPHIIGGNRDPKVIYCDELSCYIMALYMDKDVYALFTSDNLVHWTMLQQISLPGDNECPDIFPLTDETGRRKWILIGAHDKYYVGEFADGKFVPDQPLQTLHYGNAGYAAQTFTHLPDGRIVRIAWLRWGDIQNARFTQQMSIPTVLSLQHKNGVTCLCAQPVAELERLYAGEQVISAMNLEAGGERVFALPDQPLQIELELDYQLDQVLQLNCFGRKIVCNMKENTLHANGAEGPLSREKDRLKLNLIVDRCSYEFFLDDGSIVYFNSGKNAIQDRNLPVLTLESNVDCRIDTLKIHSLASIWQ